MKPWVVMRARNDMPLVADTLAMLRRQSIAHRLVVFDNASTDGTREAAAERADLVVDVPEGTYVPGRVLNQAMEATDGEMVAFLNSDCTPLDADWLGRLLSGFDSADPPRVAAVFGRQMPRPDCLPLFARDTENTFGDGSLQRHWRHCFSMASSAIRRSVWHERPFNEAIQYSEDIEWTWTVRQKGCQIRYAAGSRVYHSHNYTLGQWYRRQFGEGKADAHIFDWPAWDRSWLRYSLMPCARQILGDVKYCLRAGEAGAAFRSPLLRGAQMVGRRRGFAAGWAERRREQS
jgi:rhamnosyltransferase